VEDLVTPVRALTALAPTDHQIYPGKERTMGTLTRDAGRARLTVTGPRSVTPDGRQVWRYEIAETAGDGTVTVLETGEDLHSGVGAYPTPAEMMGSLCAFLSAAAEAGDYAMRHGVPLDETENGDLFNHAVLMLASQESDEIAMLGVELEEGDENDG
jgi:hypothetical protein